MLISEGQGVYLMVLSVQQSPVDLAGQVTPQSLGLQAGPGYLYPLSVLAYLDLGHQGSPFLLLIQEILGKNRRYRISPKRKTRKTINKHI